MENNDRTAAFLDVFRNGIIARQEKQLTETLGDRSTYLGLSDLARYKECPRAAISEKLSDKSPTLQTLLRLNRGYWFEQGVADSFSALGLNQLRQLEISYTHQDIPIKGHLDIVLVWEKPYPAVRILEIKSMANLPQTPYESHVWQVTAQTELLGTLWNNPVFSEAGDASLTFPDLCRERFCVNLPARVEECSVEGWLLCLSMTDAQAYGPFIPQTDFMQNMNIWAVTMWQQLNQCKEGTLTLNDIPFATGYYPLCNYCPVNNDCPKFEDREIQSEWEPAICRLEELKEKRSSLDLEIKEIESGLKLAYQNSGLNGWINTNQHRFRVTNTKGRMVLDKSLLASELGDLFRGMNITAFDVDAFLASCEREGTPSSRLTLQPLKQEN